MAAKISQQEEEAKERVSKDFRKLGKIIIVSDCTFDLTVQLVPP